MVESDKKQFLAVINAVMSVYSKEVSPSGFHIWWAALESYEYSDVTRAFTAYVKSADSGTFAPKPADIIRMIDGNSDDKAMMAWSKVNRAMGAAGAYRSVCFDDPVINMVVMDMGGWPKICGGTVDELQFTSAEFIKKYRAYAGRGQLREYPSVLIGLSEQQNRIAGFKSPQPTLIGNPSEAQKVLENGSEKDFIQLTSGRVTEILDHMLLGKDVEKTGFDKIIKETPK